MTNYEWGILLAQLGASTAQTRTQMAGAQATLQGANAAAAADYQNRLEEAKKKQKKVGTFGSIGGAIGSIAGAPFGAIGSMVGGALGSTVGQQAAGAGGNIFEAGAKNLANSAVNTLLTAGLDKGLGAASGALGDIAPTLKGPGPVKIPGSEVNLLPDANALKGGVLDAVTSASIPMGPGQSIVPGAVPPAGGPSPTGAAVAPVAPVGAPVAPTPAEASAKAQLQLQQRMQAPFPGAAPPGQQQQQPGYWAQVGEGLKSQLPGALEQLGVNARDLLYLAPDVDMPKIPIGLDPQIVSDIQNRQAEQADRERMYGLQEQRLGLEGQRVGLEGERLKQQESQFTRGQSQERSLAEQRHIDAISELETRVRLAEESGDHAAARDAQIELDRMKEQYKLMGELQSSRGTGGGSGGSGGSKGTTDFLGKPGELVDRQLFNAGVIAGNDGIYYGRDKTGKLVPYPDQATAVMETFGGAGNSASIMTPPPEAEGGARQDVAGESANFSRDLAAGIGRPDVPAYIKVGAYVKNLARQLVGLPGKHLVKGDQSLDTSRMPQEQIEQLLTEGWQPYFEAMQEADRSRPSARTIPNDIRLNYGP